MHICNPHRGHAAPCQPEEPGAIEVDELKELRRLHAECLSAMATARRLLADERGARPRGVLPSTVTARPRGRVVIPSHEFRELQHRALMAEKQEMPW
jgi:hypothetical protein